jgi:hypothetical protein
LVFNKKIITTKKGMFLRIYLRKIVSSGFSCAFTCENRFPADFPVDITAELPADCLQERCCKFFLIFGRKFRRKQLPTKVLAGNQNPQETCFLRIFGLKPQENPQVISKILVVTKTCELDYM